MKPQLFDSKKKLKWIPLSYLIILFFSISPLVFAWIAGLIGDSMGCNINEGGTDDCIRIGIHFGDILNGMVAGVWLFFITIPFGVILLIVLTIVAINDYNYYNKQIGQ